ncbi:hypothetical protein D3C80_2190170 [compost metagenome]
MLHEKDRDCIGFIFALDTVSAGFSYLASRDLVDLAARAASTMLLGSRPTEAQT